MVGAGLATDCFAVSIETTNRISNHKRLPVNRFGEFHAEPPLDSLIAFRLAIDAELLR